MSSNKQVSNIFNLIELSSKKIFDASIVLTFLSSIILFLEKIDDHATRQIPTPDLECERDGKTISDYILLCSEAYITDKRVQSLLEEIANSLDKISEAKEANRVRLAALNKDKTKDKTKNLLSMFRKKLSGDDSKDNTEEQSEDEEENKKIIPTKKPVKKMQKPQSGKSIKSKQDTKPLVKRAPTPYILFCNDYRESIKKEYPDLTFGETGRKLGEIWASLPEEEKAKYSKISAEIKKELEDETVSETEKDMQVELPSDTLTRSEELPYPIETEHNKETSDNTN